MPTIRPISDLRNNANEISDFCRQTHEPVYITRNGSGDMVVLSMEEYERQQALIDLYGKLAVAEQEISAGAEGEDFLTVARKLTEEIGGLSHMPERCPRPRDLALAAKGYRYLIVENYLVLYTISGQTVQIQRILYGRRNYQNIL